MCCLTYRSRGGTMRILLATDGSEYSETAAKFLNRINWTPQDSIVVFTPSMRFLFRKT